MSEPRKPRTERQTFTRSPRLSFLRVQIRSTSDRKSRDFTSKSEESSPFPPEALKQPSAESLPPEGP